MAAGLGDALFRLVKRIISGFDDPVVVVSNPNPTKCLSLPSAPAPTTGDLDLHTLPFSQKVAHHKASLFLSNILPLSSDTSLGKSLTTMQGNQTDGLYYVGPGLPLGFIVTTLLCLLFGFFCFSIGHGIATRSCHVAVENAARRLTKCQNLLLQVSNDYNKLRCKYRFDIDRITTELKNFNWLCQSLKASIVGLTARNYHLESKIRDIQRQYNDLAAKFDIDQAANVELLDLYGDLADSLGNQICEGNKLEKNNEVQTLTLSCKWSSLANHSLRCRIKRRLGATRSS